MEMRKCKNCGEIKPLKECFYKTKEINGKIYYRHDCKSCKSKKEIKRNNNLKIWFRNYKKKLSCEKCGFDDWRVLQFHHHSDNKENNVSTMVNLNYSKETIIEEINKCSVLCANCHFIEHSEF